MTQPTYQAEPWFTLLVAAAKAHQRKVVATMLGLSPATVSQVLNASGKYGRGGASTQRVADKVLHTFGRYECPHLTAEAGGESQQISADECRAFAHRIAPTGSPRDMQHWQACLRCPHKAASAPPAPAEPRSRTTTPKETT